MKNKKILLFSTVLLLCACGTTGNPTITPTTTATPTTAAPTTTVAPTTTPTTTVAPTTTQTPTTSTHVHEFVEGECACGEKDPNYVPHTHKFVDGECECGETFVAPALTSWSLVTEIKDGDNVLIGCPSHGKLLSAEKVTATSYYNKGVDYSIDNFDNVTDAEIFTVKANSDNTYTFTSLTGEVIALADSYASLNATGNNKSWELIQKTTGVFYVKNKGRGNYLEWYDSKGNWSTFATSSLSNLFEISFYAKAESSDGEHVHNYISDVHDVTCTEDGYTTYTCRCGDSYTVDGEKSQGHKYAPEVTKPTCTEDGYTTYTCSCGDSYVEPGDKAEGHVYEGGKCTVCGEEDPDYHVHNYSEEVTEPTCSAGGYTTYTCSCGDTYTGNETNPVDHVDTNLDITCDFEGCTKRILPPADSKISLFTANCMIIVSLSSSYYVEGVITEITDVLNGIFIITDEAGDTILIRLPKNADGVSYAQWTTKVVVGDTVSVYGKPVRNTGAPTTQAAKIEGGVLTVVKHEHNFGEATCNEPATCACKATSGEALGHSDENGDFLCDRCNWNTKLQTTEIVIATDPTLANGVLAEDQSHWTWANDQFDVVIAKGTSTFTIYKTAKSYMQLKKQNTLTINNKIGATMSLITISTTNATQLTNLKGAIADQYEYTADDLALTVTIKYDKAEDFVLEHQGSTTAYVSKVSIAYIPA